MKTKQAELWEGKFGDEYAERNRLNHVDITNRMQFWDRLTKQIYFHANTIPYSYLEVGAGVGANIVALQNVYNLMEKSVDVYATEINEKSAEKLREIDGLTVLPHIGNLSKPVDCVFTMGVLIHVHPAYIKPIMRDMYHASRRWIVCAEYFAPETRQIPYRGEENALWLDDYGAKWVNNFALKVISYGFLWKQTTGLDNITFWIMEKI